MNIFIFLGLNCLLFLLKSLVIDIFTFLVYLGCTNFPRRDESRDLTGIIKYIEKVCANPQREIRKRHISGGKPCPKIFKTITTTLKHTVLYFVWIVKVKFMFLTDCWDTSKQVDVQLAQLHPLKKMFRSYRE